MLRHPLDMPGCQGRYLRHGATHHKNTGQCPGIRQESPLWHCDIALAEELTGCGARVQEEMLQTSEDKRCESRLVLGAWSILGVDEIQASSLGWHPSVAGVFWEIGNASENETIGFSRWDSLVKLKIRVVTVSVKSRAATAL